MTEHNFDSIRTLQSALAALCGTSKTQSQGHIKPLHYHLSDRLVLEGGFAPEWVTPTPPLAARCQTNLVGELRPEPAAGNSAEHCVLGGIKPKAIDVTVSVPGVGPALGISAKSTGNAFRNLTNRMEEALGDCANIHMMYPGFVFGFLHFVRYATVATHKPADASFDEQGRPLPSIARYHDVLVSLSSRSTITDPAMRYESVGLVIYRDDRGYPEIHAGYPPATSAVHFARFFERLYQAFDLRYAYPDSSRKNWRKVWNTPAGAFAGSFDEATGFGWRVRLHDEE